MMAGRRNIWPADGAGVPKPCAEPSIPTLREGNDIRYTEGPVDSMAGNCRLCRPAAWSQ